MSSSSFEPAADGSPKLAYRPLEILQLALIAGMFLVSAMVWPSAPDRIPVHWNLAGEVDRFGGKPEGLLFAPLLALGMYLLLLFLPRIDPRRVAYAAFARGYAVLRTALVVFLAAVHAMVLLAAFGHAVEIRVLVPLAVGILFCVIGGFIGRTEPNWFVGVRTPWTLSSAKSWRKSNRLAAKLFFAAACALFLFAIVHNAWTLGIVLVMVGLLAVGVPVYSYWVWRNDASRSAG